MVNWGFFPPTSVRLARLIERLRDRWKRQRAVAESVATPQKTPKPARFTITLDCEAGAKGLEVARALGERLGWQVYDHELVELIARQMGVRAELLDSLDERRVTWLDEVSMAFFAGLSVSANEYARHLVETFFALAAHGECVIVGHGAAQVLPEETTLRVRLVGPLKERIAEVQRRSNRPHDEAARLLEQKDRERKEFVMDHFNKDVANPDGYDLLLNAFRFPATQCAELTASALSMVMRGPIPQPLVPATAPDETTVDQKPPAVEATSLEELL